MLYPAFEKYLVDGGLMADHDRADHQKAKDILFELQDMNAGYSIL